MWKRKLRKQQKPQKWLNKRIEKRWGQIVNYLDKLLENSIYPNEIIKLFYLEPISNNELESYGGRLDTAVDSLIEVLNSVNVNTIIDIIDANRDKINAITPETAPIIAELYFPWSSV